MPDAFSFPLQIQLYQFGDLIFHLYVPDAKAVQDFYQKQKAVNPSEPFPYWTQLWPAAKALCHFLVQHPHYIKSKRVLELAAGLGLPSLVASTLVAEVCCSDYLPEAVAVMQKTVAYNRLKNMSCRVINWHGLPPDLPFDVVLLSDINYHPPEFEVLYTVLLSLLEKGSTLILSTPQRLMAKPFIERLLPWCSYQQEIEVEQSHLVPISIFVFTPITP